MAPSVVLRPRAIDDMEAIALYIAKASPTAADRFLENCRADFERLAEMPGLGAKREFRNLIARDVRSWILSGFPNHLIFYRPVEGGIEVLRLLHGARDIEAIFEP